MHPILFKLGPITVYSYGFMVAMGFAIGTFLAQRRARDEGIEPQRIVDLAVFILISGIVGARFLYVLLNMGLYIKSPLDVFKLNQGGLVFYGGAISAAATALAYIKRHELPFEKLTNIIMPYVALGQAIGRIGCLLNGCCYGRPAQSAPFVFHPTQGYESLALIGIFLILRASRRGLFFKYCLLYPFARFFIEFFRGDILPYKFGLTFSQVISVAVFVTAIAFYPRTSPEPR